MEASPFPGTRGLELTIATALARKEQPPLPSLAKARTAEKTLAVEGPKANIRSHEPPALDRALAAADGNYRRRPGESETRNFYVLCRTAPTVACSGITSARADTSPQDLRNETRLLNCP